MRLRQPYKLGDLPAGLVRLTMGVDVQKNRLVYAIRGWGSRATSWLVDRGELHGETHEEEVWEDLADLMQTPVHGALINLTLIDSGFRPGKTFNVPVNRVYEFCRRHSRVARPSKGRATQSMPVKRSKIEVTPKGSPRKYSLELMLIDTDWAKSFVHEHARYPVDALGAWLLPDDIDERYCAQIVSEARIRRPSGHAQWIQRSRENHFLDCEALNAAAGHLLNVQRIKEGRGLRETLSANIGDAAPLEDETVTVETIEDPPPATSTPASSSSRPRGAAVVPPRRRSWAELSALLNK
jgi:phage terminase large subunit GpA-like protein